MAKSKPMPKTKHWHPTFQDSAMLLVESQFVIGLRLFHLASGGVAAHREAPLLGSGELHALPAPAAAPGGGGAPPAPFFAPPPPGAPPPPPPPARGGRP